MSTPKFEVEPPLYSRRGETRVSVPLGFTTAHTGIPAMFVCSQISARSLRTFHTPSLERAYRVRDAWHAGRYPVAGSIQSFDSPTTESDDETTADSDRIDLVV